MSKKSRGACPVSGTSDDALNDVVSKMDNLIDLVKMAVTTSNKNSEAVKKFEETFGKFMMNIEDRVAKLEHTASGLHKKFDEIIDLFLKYNDNGEKQDDGQTISILNTIRIEKTEKSITKEIHNKNKIEIWRNLLMTTNMNQSIILPRWKMISQKLFK